jgi:ketosteroid isomerase-like protein
MTENKSGPVTEEERERLADAYFEALDAPDYDALRSVFAPDIVYLYPDAAPIEGLDDAIRFFEEEKPTSDTDHHITQYVHGPSVTVAEGVSTGLLDGDPFESHFCDVIEFDDGRIDRLAVYSRVQRDPDE